MSTNLIRYIGCEVRSHIRLIVKIMLLIGLFWWCSLYIIRFYNIWKKKKKVKTENGLNSNSRSDVTTVERERKGQNCFLMWKKQGFLFVWHEKSIFVRAYKLSRVLFAFSGGFWISVHLSIFPLAIVMDLYWFFVCILIRKWFSNLSVQRCITWIEASILEGTLNSKELYKLRGMNEL